MRSPSALAALAGLACCLSITAFAAPGPGITQVTWAANEVGTEVYRFPTNIVGPQPTYADFHNGYLYIGAAESVNKAIPGRVGWFNLSNPRSPSLITSITATGNKPHMAGFWGDRMIDGFQATSFRIWDFDDKFVAGNATGAISPVFYFVQAPYIYRPRNGYGSGANLLDIMRVTNTGGVRVTSFDLGTRIGFAVGALHAVGNLLICSASQARGLAVFDIGDPADPKLLGQIVTGNNVYTSYVYGNRIYQCETGIGIRVYDFSDPTNLQVVGFIATGNSPRYVTVKEGQGYCCPGTSRMVRFDAQTLVTNANWSLPAGADFAQIIGNFAITGGNQGNERCSVVPVKTAPDTNGPTVGFANPASGEQDVPVTGRIGFIMSEPIDVASLNITNVIVRPVGGSAIAGTIATQMGIFNFTPASPLQPDTAYEVILPAGGVKDAVGNGIPETYQTTFRTKGATPDGSLARWRFNNTLFDDSGFNRHLVTNGGATIVTDHKEGPQGLLLNGIDGRAEAPAFSLTDHFTLSAWVRIPSGRSNIQTIAANSGNGATTPGFRLFVNTAGTTDRRLIFETGNGTQSALALTPTNSFPYDQWNHVAVSVNRSLGVARLYVNGIERGTNVTIRTDFQNTNAIDLGRMRNGTFYLGGNLDDVRLLPGEVTGTQVRHLSPGDVSGQWPLNGSGADISGFARDVSPVNGTTFSSNRVEGTQSASLDGSNDYLLGPSFTVSNSFSLAAWVYIPSGANSSNIQTIAANSGSGSTTGWRLFVNGFNTINQRLILETANGDGIRAVTNQASWQSASGAFAFDQWNHVALTVNRAAGTAQIFYNGTALVPVGSTVRTDFTPTGPITLGAFATGSFPLNGLLDDVRLFDRSLATDDVRMLMTLSNANPVIPSLAASTNSPLVGQSLTFTASATDPDPGDALLYSFNFGDGSPATPFSTNSAASRTYSAPGRYPVTVRVSDGVILVTRQLLVVVHHPLTSPAPTASSPLVIDAAQGKVWCANSDNDTITRLTASSLAKDLEVPAGVHPKSLALAPDGLTLWVTCQDSDDVRVFDTTSGSLVTNQSLGYGSAPNALAFAPDGSAVFVATSGSRRLLKLNPATRAVLGTLELGSRASAVSVSGDSSRVLVTRFISPDTAGEVWEVNPSTMTLVRTFTLAIDTTPDTPNSGRGLPNYLRGAVITPDGRRAWVPSKKDNIQRGLARDGLALTHDNSVRCIVSQLDLLTNGEDVASRFDIDNHSLPGAAAFTPKGDVIAVAMEANNTVRLLDTATRNLLAAVDAGSGPESVCLTSNRLYVLNSLSRTVSAFNIADLLAGISSDTPLVAETPVVASEQLTPQVLQGKRLFYNAADERMAAEGYQSCAACHLDGDTDGRVWDFTNRGEGFRNTTDLRGRSGTGHGFVHWSANFDEIQDFEHDMRNAFGGSGFLSDAEFNTGTRNQSLGTPKAGVNADLDAMAAYVASLNAVPRSPWRSTNGAPTPSAVIGRQHYVALGCYTCHGGAPFTDSGAAVLHDVGTLKPTSGQRLGGTLAGIDSPTLRGVFDTAPYLHDGSAATLADVFTVTNAPPGSAHATVRTLSTNQQAELIAFLRQLDASDVAAPSVPAEAWKEQQFGLSWSTNAAAADLADPDADGLPNQFEYGLGSGPLASDTTASGTVGIHTNRLTLSFTRNTAATDLDFTVEAADQLAGPWSTVARSTNGAPFGAVLGGVIVNESGAGPVRSIQVQDAYQVTDPARPQRFLRLRTER